MFCHKSSGMWAFVLQVMFTLGDCSGLGVSEAFFWFGFKDMLHEMIFTLVIALHPGFALYK